MPQSKQLTGHGHSSTTSRQAALKPLEPPAAPGQGLAHQRPQDPALPTSRQTPATRKLQPHSVWTQLAHKEAKFCPGTSWAMALSLVNQHKLKDTQAPQTTVLGTGSTHQ